MSAAYAMTPTSVIETEALGTGRDDLPRASPLANLFAHGVDAPVIVLRNSGGKPVRVHGVLLAEGSSRNGATAMWHEVAIYRTDSGTIAVAIRFMRAGGIEWGVHRARLFDDTDAAASWLEHFDCGFDVTADFDVSDPHASAVSVALKAASLRDRAQRLDRDYRSLVGEVLFRLETEV